MSISSTTSTASSTLCTTRSSLLDLTPRPLRSVTCANTHPYPRGNSACSNMTTKRSCQASRSWAFLRMIWMSCSENRGRRLGFSLSVSRSLLKPSRCLSGGAFKYPSGKTKPVDDDGAACKNEDREDGKGRESPRLDIESEDGDGRGRVDTGAVIERSCSRYIYK